EAAAHLLMGIHVNPQRRLGRVMLEAASRLDNFGVAQLAALAAASFLNALTLRGSPRNEMSIGMLGEPATLNPIKAADSAGAAVQGAIFNGLLKYNENLEVVPDLAERFTLSQTTIIFFRDEYSALEGLLRLQAQRRLWPAWKLESARLDGSSLVLRLSEPGMETSREMAGLLPPAEPLRQVRIALKEPAGAAVEKLKAAVGGGRILRVWQGSPLLLEATVLAGESEARAAVSKYFEAVPGAEISDAGERPFLAEPEILFDLRRDVRWHDGQPFTSRDAVYTYQAIMDDATASPRKPDFEPVLRVEAPSPHQFRVIYRQPFSPAVLSWMMPMLPAHILEGTTPEWQAANFDRRPVGTGPFRFAEWRTNQFVLVVRNPDYFDAPGPWLDGMVFRVLADQLALRLAFETRQVDFWGVDPWAVGGFEKDSRFDLFSMPGNSYTYVGWNLRNPLFEDLRVRQALAHAVNVPAMVKFILFGHGVQSTGIFTPQMWFFNPEVEPLRYDPAHARELLKEAGWVPGPDGILTKDGRRFSFTLITNNGNETRRDIATLVQDDLRRLGIEVKIELYEWAVFLRNFINKGSFDAMVLGWALGFDFDQYQIWHSSQTNPEQLNVVGYKNSEVDRLLEDLRQEYNRRRIIAMAGRLQEIIYHDQPYLFLFVPQSVSVVWRNSFRIRRPVGGVWKDTPIEMTKAGWSYYQDWFYRPEFASHLPPAGSPVP
ncbi:MAG: peptide-binding protein, partial [Terrimicrobiaceae bacterium]|nr:peptide-binding protein [Terrimicrobiaceae bacterium]